MCLTASPDNSLMPPPDPSVVIDADGRILYANGRVKDVLGYEPVELIDQHMEVLLPERFRTVH